MAIKPTDTLRTNLGESTCTWMRLICQNKKSVTHVVNNSQMVRVGTWYCNENFKAMQIVLKSSQSDTASADFKRTAQEVADFLERKNAHIIGYVSAKFFDRIPDNSNPLCRGERGMHFLVKKDVKPSDALKEAAYGLSIFDCGVACQISRYGALLDWLKETKFNTLFGSSPKGERMNIGYLIDDELQPMKYFVEFTEAATLYGTAFQQGKTITTLLTGKIGERKVKVGQLVYIKGVATHPKKHPWDGTGSYNMICCADKPGEQCFLAFGQPVEGITEVKIGELLVDAYNQPTEWKNKHPDFKNPGALAFAAPYANHTATALDPAKGEGFDCSSIQDFRIDLIQDLINLPEDKVSMDYVKKHPSQKRSPWRVYQ